MLASEEERATGDALWDACDVAAYFKASRSWVYLRVERGEIPFIRRGGLLRFDPEAIRAWARGESTPTAQIIALPKGA